MSNNKVEYVKEEAKKDRGTTGHFCHWPGCRKAVPPAMWGCKPHWFALPQNLRTRIWSAYKPGQEITKTPSDEYIQVMIEVNEYIKTKLQK